MRSVYLLLALLTLIAGVTMRSETAASLPLQAGEQLTYRVSWAIVRGAGEIKVEARPDPVVPNVLLVTSTTATKGFAKMLMQFQAVGESRYDRATGKLVSIKESSNTRGRQRDHTVTFDHAGRQASYVTPDSKRPTLLEMPPGDPSDLIMALLNTRSWDLKPGQSRDALVLFDDDFYELTIHATGYEEVNTPLGRFNTLVLEPRMEKTPPKGMFRRGSTVKVWIAQNELRVPVRFAVEFNIGTGTATLDSYVPPPAAPPIAGAAANVHAENPRP